MTIYVTQAIRHGRDRLHMAPQRRQSLRPQGLSLRTFNIRNGQVYRIKQAIRAARIGRFDLKIMMETKINGQPYCCNRMGCDMVCSQAITMAADDAQGGVGLVVQYQPQVWIIESMRFHGTNVVSSEVVTGKLTPNIGE